MSGAPHRSSSSALPRVGRAAGSRRHAFAHARTRPRMPRGRRRSFREELVVKVLRLLFIGISLASTASACDLCSVYASLQARDSAKGWFGGAFEQYTHFGTLRVDGDEVPNPLDQ